MLKCFVYISDADTNKTPQVGFEPTTNRLTVDRSTAELLRQRILFIVYTIYGL